MPPAVTQPPIVNKPLVGVIGFVCLVTSAVCLVYYPEQSSLQGSTMRVGIVMLALFFVLPKRGENARWNRILPVFVGLVGLIAFSKRMILVILPLLLVIGVMLTILRPRDKVRPPRRG